MAFSTVHCVRLLALAVAGTVAVAAQPASAAPAPGRITTVVRDAGSGAPVAGVTVHAVSTEDRFGDLWSVRGVSGPDGTVALDGLAPGRYAFFVQPGDPAYGMQWLGDHGGTGDRDSAVLMNAPATGTRTLPDVRLDPAGTVAGALTDARTGAPLSAQVAVASVDPLWQETTPSVFGTGSYTFAGLGPYPWALFFLPEGAAGHTGAVAAHWSGGVPSRRQAQKIPVVAGRTTVADQLFQPGTTISGAVADGPVYAFHASTHEILAVSDHPDVDRYAVRLLPGQRVKLCIARTRCHPGGIGLDAAVPVPVGARPLVLDLPGS